MRQHSMNMRWPAMFTEAIAQDVNSTEAETMAVVQKPFSTSIFAEKSGPPAWKQLPTWYQVSENDHMIPPDAERKFPKQMNARGGKITQLDEKRLRRMN